jgi:hypothetical protein
MNVFIATVTAPLLSEVQQAQGSLAAGHTSDHNHHRHVAKTQLHAHPNSNEWKAVTEQFKRTQDMLLSQPTHGSSKWC